MVDPAWKNDPEMLEHFAFMKRYYPEGNVSGRVVEAALTQVLTQCGDDLARP